MQVVALSRLVKSFAVRAFKSLPLQIDVTRHSVHHRGFTLQLHGSRKRFSSTWSREDHMKPSNVGSASLVGRRKTNEDRFKVSHVFVNVLYLAVFDGHGGPEAADYCEAHMEEHIRGLAREARNLEVVLAKAFVEVDQALAEQSSHSGTTATVALLRDDTELVVASVGDSRALLCREGKGLQLTNDHTAERKDERERIERSGGFVVRSSCGHLYVNGRLAMTRSIGDLEFKEFGVIAEPEIKRIVLTHEHDAFLALTTDGIIMKSQEICSIVHQSQDPSQAAQRVCDQALAHGSEDNVTVVIVPLGSWGKNRKSD